MRRLKCACGGALPDPPPTHCPHCGAKIIAVRRRVNWLAPVIVFLLFAAVVAFMLYLAASF